jgi:hypothetical protein
MTERLDPVVSGWLKSTDEPPPDPIGSVNVAMGNVQRTRQYRRWWPLPILERMISPAVGAPSRELTPAAVPATNGHSPVPTGRTRTMFSAAKLVAGAALLALTGGLFLSGVMTTGPDDPAPAAPAERTDFIIVAGTSTLSAGSSPSGDDSMSDPRVSGHANLLNHYLAGDVDLTGVNWGQYTLTNDGGTWEGEWMGFYESPGDDDDYGTPGAQNAMIWASGTGDYEGWSYVANYTGRLLGLDVKGLLYQGDIPPTVALGLLQAETE